MKSTGANLELHRCHNLRLFWHLWYTLMSKGCGHQAARNCACYLPHPSSFSSSVTLKPLRLMEIPTVAWMSCGLFGLAWALYWVVVQMLSAYQEPKLHTSKMAPIHNATNTRMHAHNRCNMKKGGGDEHCNCYLNDMISWKNKWELFSMIQVLYSQHFNLTAGLHLMRQKSGAQVN